jgi:hypothetical protein
MHKTKYLGFNTGRLYYFNPFSMLIPISARKILSLPSQIFFWAVLGTLIKGETSWKFETRINEHRDYINKDTKDSGQTALIVHCKE